MTPVPGLPGLSVKPGSVFTTTIFKPFPEIVLPELVTLEVTTTPMYDGTVAAGLDQPPGPVVQLPAHVAGGVDVGRLIVEAKPFAADGAARPERAFAFDHCEPKYVSFVVGVAAPASCPRS